MVVYNVSFSPNNRINKLAPPSHIYFSPAFTFAFNALYFSVLRSRESAILSPPVVLSRPSDVSTPLSPDSEKKRHFLLLSVRSQPKFCLTSYLTALRAIASLLFARDTLRRFYLAPRRFTHMYTCTRTRDGMTRKLRFRHPRWTTTALRLSERSCIRSLHWARSKIYDIM